jgi:malate/lactate dehydrogenase
MKVGIIGAGAVGSACLTALAARGCAREIVVVDRTRAKAEGLVTDVQYGAVLYPHAELRAGDYSDLEGAALVMITAGANEKTGGATDRNDPAGRLRLLDTNAAVYKSIIEDIGASQHGIGIACARIAGVLLRNEPAVIPIASYNPEYGVTLSLPSVLGRSGVVRILEPPMSDEERQALQRSADTLKSASARMQFRPS